MKRAVALALAVAWVVALGCGARVAVETDPNARHGAWKRWAWLSRSPIPKGEPTWTLVDERVRASLEREMKARGFRKVDRERPDFLVTYYAALDKPIDAQVVTYAAGMPSGAKSAVDAQGAYAQGTLLVDVLDAKTGKLVWRGTARGVVETDQTPEERRERIDEVVAAVVEQFAAR